MLNPSGVFLDTSGWIALLDDDELHAQAVACLDDIGAAHRMVLTTDWVVAENRQ